MKPFAVVWLSLFPLLFGFVLWSCFQAEKERRRLLKKAREIAPEVLAEIFGAGNVWPFDARAKFDATRFQAFLKSPLLTRNDALQDLRTRFQISEKRGVALIVTLLVLWLAVWLRLWLAP